MSVFYHGTVPKREILKQNNMCEKSESKQNTFNPSKETLEKIAKEANKEQREKMQGFEKQTDGTITTAESPMASMGYGVILNERRDAREELKKEIIEWIDNSEMDGEEINSVISHLKEI